MKKLLVIDPAIAAVGFAGGVHSFNSSDASPLILVKNATGSSAASGTASSATQANVSNAISDACDTSCDDVSGNICNASTTSFCTSCEHTASTARGKTKAGRTYGPGFNVDCSTVN